MSDPVFDLDHALALLGATPATLQALLPSLPTAWKDARTEGPATFSARDVVGHLIWGERSDWVPRLRLILEHGEDRAFTPFDRTGFEPYIASRAMADLLAEFATLRRANLESVRSLMLTDADLERRGRHPEFGSVTARQLLATWVVHDLGHLAQISRVLAKRYVEEVGPWSAYLPVLHR
jgi:hypothetical protein